jgi:hypothetical protein
VPEKILFTVYVVYALKTEEQADIFKYKLIYAYFFVSEFEFYFSKVKI